MENVVKAINKFKNIAITYHTSPDGDALGSALALLRALKKYGKNPYIVSKDTIGKDFAYLNFENDIKGEVVEVKDETECLITVDCGNVERLSGDFDFENKKYFVINIDHHLSNDKFGDINYVDTSAAATAEIIYKLIKNMNIDIDKDIASCLYTSLLTDTGCFKHSGTSKTTHEIAGELISTGIDFTNIRRELFENKSKNKIQLYGKVINNLEFLNDDKLCIMTLTMDMLKELNLEGEDTSDVLSLASQINTVEVVVLLKETEEKIKVSLRAKNYFDVRNIAEQFNGGGHIKASGCAIANVKLNEAKNKIVEAINKVGFR